MREWGEVSGGDAFDSSGFGVDRAEKLMDQRLDPLDLGVTIDDERDGTYTITYRYRC